MRNLPAVLIMLGFGLPIFLIGSLATPYLLGTAVTPAPPMSAEEANAVLNIVQLEQTVAARREMPTPQATPAGPVEVYIVGIAPSPTSTPFPRKPTVTPFPSCPNPGTVCEWVDVAPTRIVPSPTAYPICLTPVPGARCRDTGAAGAFAAPLLTPQPTSDLCGNPFGGPWPTLSPEFATITPTWATPTPNPACATTTPVMTPEARCWSAGWHRRVCWPSGCRALSEAWC